jgi:hypothetical protein
MADVIEKTPTVESVLVDLLKLSPRERLEVIAQAVQRTEHEIPEEPKKPLKSLWGLWADYGPAPSAEDIDEARREMWGNFPRDDF